MGSSGGNNGGTVDADSASWKYKNKGTPTGYVGNEYKSDAAVNASDQPGNSGQTANYFSDDFFSDVMGKELDLNYLTQVFYKKGGTNVNAKVDEINAQLRDNQQKISTDRTASLAAQAARKQTTPFQSNAGVMSSTVSPQVRKAILGTADEEVLGV